MTSQRSLHKNYINHPSKRLEFIKNNAKKYPYFLRLDIQKFYPTINHAVLLAIIKKYVYKNQTPTISSTSKWRQNKEIEKIKTFLDQSPLGKKGLPLGSNLSRILAKLYLLPLNLAIKRPFLQLEDDFLIFCRQANEASITLQREILPILEYLHLEINVKKTSSGRFHQQTLDFLGFRYYNGQFTITPEKIDTFKEKIVKITHLTRTKPAKAVIKKLNYKILGFGHYYKLSASGVVFEELDAFCRQRLRRYLIRNKNQKQKVSNILLTNNYLASSGLKSLHLIRQKYVHKKRLILTKKVKNTQKSGKTIRQNNLNISYSISKDSQKEINLSLNNLYKKICNIEKDLKEINKKLEI